MSTIIVVLVHGSTSIRGDKLMLKRDAIRDRLTDAMVLWHSGRKNGAFIQALVALAGLASIRYPKKTSPKVYFDKMREYHPSQKTQIAANESKQTKNRLSDGQQFKCMVLDLLPDFFHDWAGQPVVPGQYDISLPLGKAKTTNIEDLFYKLLRCKGVHEGTFASVAYLTERTLEGDRLELTEPAGIPEWWVVHLVNVVSKAPELA